MYLNLKVLCKAQCLNNWSQPQRICLVTLFWACFQNSQTGDKSEVGASGGGGERATKSDGSMKNWIMQYAEEESDDEDENKGLANVEVDPVGT